MEPGSFSSLFSDRTRSNDTNWNKHRKSCLNRRKHFFTVNMIEYWNRSPKEAVEFCFSEIFKDQQFSCYTMLRSFIKCQLLSSIALSSIKFLSPSSLPVITRLLQGHTHVCWLKYYCQSPLHLTCWVAQAQVACNTLRFLLSWVSVADARGRMVGRKKVVLRHKLVCLRF